jgi:hypothetical protein
MICPGGLLLVVSDLLAVLILVLWVGLEGFKFKLDEEKSKHIGLAQQKGLTSVLLELVQFAADARESHSKPNKS